MILLLRSLPLAGSSYFQVSNNKHKELDLTNEYCDILKGRINKHTKKYPISEHAGNLKIILSHISLSIYLILILKETKNIGENYLINEQEGKKFQINK